MFLKRIIRITLLSLAMFLRFTFIAEAQIPTSPATAIAVNTFPSTQKITNSSAGGSASGMGGSCHTLACCSVWVYKVTIPTSGSLRIDNLSFTPLGGSIIAYKANKANPTSFSDLTYVSGQPGNFCGYRDSLVLGWHYTWTHPNRTAAQNAKRTIGWRTNATDTIGAGTYYILAWCKNNQANIGNDTATFRFRFAPHCGGTTGRTCPPVLDITGNDHRISNGNTTASADNNTLFDSVSVDGSKTLTYAIENSMDSFFTLNGTNPVSISGSSAFSLLGQPSDRSIDNTDSTTFQIKYTPTGIGSDTALVKIANNVSKNDTFSFYVYSNCYDLRPIAYAQKFEGTTTDNWNYTPDPPKYATETDSVIAGSEDIWDIIREFTGDIDDPYDGRYFWGTQDLNNSNGGRSYAHHLNFDNVFVANLTNSKLKFNYYSDGFDSSDSLFYELFLDNVGQGKVHAEKNSDAWLTVRYDIPSNVDSFGFRWSAYNDGSTDYSGFDGLEIRGSTGSSTPALIIDSMVVNSYPSCSNGSTGKATAHVSGGTRPYSYSWQGLSATDSFISNLAAGTYYVTVTDSNSTSVNDSVTITAPAALSALSPAQSSPKNTTLSGVYGGWLDNSTGIVESNPSTFVFAGQTSNTDHRGWLKFDVSGISPGSQVDSIILELYCNRANGSGTLNVDVNSASEVEGPFGSPNTTAYADFGDGTYTTVAVTGVGTYSGIKLGSSANSDLENQLSDGYFQLALDNHNNTDWKRFTSNLCNIKVYYIAKPSKQESLCYGEIGDTVDVFDTASGGSGNYTYFWQVSRDLGQSYAAASGTNNTMHYTPTENLYDTTYYRRGIVDQTCGDTVYNDPAKYFVADSLYTTINLDSNASTLTSTDGGVTANVNGGVSPFTYAWSNSASTSTLTGLTVGWYTVTVTDAFGCSFTDSIEVKRRYSLDVSVSNHVSCNGLSDGSATAQVEGGVAPITIDWSSLDTGSTVTTLSAGTYYITAYDANKDSLLDSITITEPAVLAASALIDSNATCFGLSNAGATASATGGTTPYTYAWSNSATTASINGVSAGTYTITITDANGCTSTNTASVTQPDSIAMTLTVDSTVSCNGLMDGGASSSLSGGTTPYTYIWSNSATTASITNMGAGTYTLTVTDNNGCNNNRSTVITEPALLSTTVNVDSNVTCNGDLSGVVSTTATGGTAPYTYLWSNAKTTSRLSKMAAGAYTVTVTDANGCTDTDNETITEPALLTSGSITGNDVVCSGVAPNKITEISAASGGTGTLNYQWQMSSDNSNWTDISGATSSEYQPMGTVGNTWYRRTVTDANNCGPFISNTIKITINGQPKVGFATNAACEGKQTNFTDETTLNSGKIASYQWSFGDQGTSNQQNPINVYKNSATYTVSLTVVTDSGCVDSTSKLVSVNPVPTVDFSATTECEGTATTFTNKSTVSAGTMIHSWDLGDNSGSTTTSPSHTYTNAGYYTVQLTATSDKGCVDSISKTVQVKQVAKPNFSATSVCEGNNTSFTNLSTNAKTHSWDFGNTAGTSTKENPSYKYAASGSYTAILMATSADGCSDTVHKNVTVYGLPTAGFSATEVCLGQSTDYTNSSKSATNYQWVFGNGTSSNKFEPSLIYGKAGTYTVELTATTANGCKDVTTASVTVNALPQVGFTTSDVCLSDALKTTNTTTGASGYAWTFGDGSKSTANSPSHTYSVRGNYKVLLIATSNKGCVDSTKTNINAFAEPKVYFTAKDECFGTDIAFTNTSKIAAGSMTYNWTLGDGNTSGNPSPSYAYAKTGTYTVKLVASSNQGCKDSSTSNVTVFTQPVVGFSTLDICQSDALITTNNSTGGGVYTWNFGDGSTSSMSAPTHNYTQPGTYKVRLEALTSNGCYDVDSIFINAFTEPQASFTANDVCFGNSTEFKNKSTIATGTMTYVWDLGDGTSTGNPAPSYVYKKEGNYSIKLVATSNNGCKDSTTGSIDVFAMPTARFSAANVCYGDTFRTNNLSAGTATYSWSFGDGNVSTSTAPNNFYSANGNYNVKLIATTNNNCVDSMSRAISIYAKPIAGFDAKDVCDETAVSLANTSYGAIINKNEWSFGDGVTSLVINPSHTYTTSGGYTAELITTSDNGCSDTISKLITIHPNPVVAFANSTECDYDSTVFTNNTSIAGGSATYIWNFGTGDNSSLTSPKYMFPQAGAYVVGLKAVSDKGCERSATSTVVVHPSPVAGILLANNCEGFESNFKSTSSLSKGKIASYNWDLGDGNTSTKMNPVHLYNLDGVYAVSLITTTDKTCTDTALANITVYNKPVADFSTPDVCFNQLNVFKDASIDAKDYLYNFGDKWGISTLASPEYTYEAPGSYAATLYVTSVNGCKDTVIKTIVVHALPEARFDVNNHCFGETFEPKDKSKGNPSKWDWDYADGNTGTGSSPSHNYTKDGDYSVKLTVTDGNNCIDSFRKTVSVWPLPKVWIRTDTLVSKGYTVPLEARGGVIYKWSPVENLDKPLSAKPIATVVEDITYTATVANEFGCIKDTSVDLRIREDYTLQPSNIMTPDGNGQNDNWVVEKAQYYNDVEVLVFDRWGRIVYQNKSYDNSWSGISVNGEPLPDGAYYYVVKVPADREEYKGSITIFR